MVRIVLLVLFLAVNLYSQEFSVRAYSDTTDYLIGDYIKLNFIVEHEKRISFAEPSFRDSISNIDFIGVNKSPVKETDGRITTAYEVILSRYDSADIRIAPITFYYWYGSPGERADFLMGSKYESDTTLMKAKSNEVSFRVDALNVNVEEEIKDIKEPLTIPLDWRIIFLIILAGLALIAAGYFLYNKFRKKRLEYKPEVFIPAHVRALTALNELEKSSLWQKGLIKEFHSEITGIIRRYFEERFGLPALELTTGETLVLLENTEEAKVILDDAEVFLNNADLVKFAKFVPVNDVNEMMMKKAYKMIEETIPAEKAEEKEAADVQ
jgi:hypothetical protein